MGEGLTVDKARDTTFLLTGAGTWVGKLAYLAADPMTIQEGRWAIAQAITDHRVKVRIGEKLGNKQSERIMKMVSEHW